MRCADRVSGRGENVFAVLFHEKREGPRVAPPFAEPQMGIRYRIGDEFDRRHRAGKLGQRARHVIIAGDHDQRTEPAILSPALGFRGVAEGVLRAMAEVDATLEDAFEFGIDYSRQCLRPDGRVHSGDQEARGAALREEA